MSSATALRPPRDIERSGNTYEGLDGFDAEGGEGCSPEEVAEWPGIGSLAGSNESDLQAEFSVLADELEDRAAVLSSTRRAASLPPFNEILALGDAVIPAVLARLKTSRNRPLWLRMLGTLTPFPPGAGEDTVDAAADAWIQWGRKFA